MIAAVAVDRLRDGIPPDELGSDVDSSLRLGS
jgi:hypothetical protein